MEDMQLRVETLLRKANQAVDVANNGMHDRGELIELISQFIPLVEDLIKSGQRERREMTNRLRRSPFGFDETSQGRDDLPIP